MTRKLRIIGKMGPTSLLLSTALAACTVGPDYTAPKTELAPFHNAADASSAQGHSAPPLDRWWTGFDDPMLVTVVQRALNENLDLDAAFARVRQARATASGAGAQLLPTIDLDTSRTYEHQSLNGAFGSVANGSPGFHRDGHEDVIGPSSPQNARPKCRKARCLNNALASADATPENEVIAAPHNVSHRL